MEDQKLQGNQSETIVNLQSAKQKFSKDDVPDALKRALPHAVDVEKRLLSSMIQDPNEYLGRAAEMHLGKDHFYKTSHAQIFEIITDMQDKGEAIDIMLLTEKLRSKDVLDNIGGVAELTDIATCETLHANFNAYLDLVKDKAVLRRVIHTCSRSSTDAYTDPEDVSAFLDQFEQAVFEIKESDEEVSKDSMAKDYLTDIYDQIEAYACGEQDKMEGLDTGYNKLNMLCNGLKGGEMFIIAARPSMGKTSFMMNIVEHVAVTNKHSTLVFSCEMPSKSLVQRLLFTRSGIPMNRMRPGLSMNKQEILDLRKAVSEIKEAELHLDDTPSLTIGDLRAKARRMKREKGIEIIAVDYLQLMRSNSKQAASSREREIAEISAGLKAVAKELDVPIIVLAQLNRGPENRGGLPRMSDLRESGSIEQDADMVGLLYRKAYYKEGDEKQEDDGDSVLVLAKNRNGATENVYLTFKKELMKFVHRERNDDEEE